MSKPKWKQGKTKAEIREIEAGWKQKARDAKAERRANNGTTRKQMNRRKARLAAEAKGTKKPRPARTEAQKRHDRYLASDGWKKRRKQYFSAHEEACLACGSKKEIHLHHKTYVRLGRELDEDLVPLCQGCHHRVHALEKLSPDGLAAVTDRYVRSRKGKQ